MRKIVFAVALLALAASVPRVACGGGRELAAAGNVLSGIAAAAFRPHGLEPRPVHRPAPGPAPLAYFEAPLLAGDGASAPVIVCQQRVYLQPVPAVGTFVRDGFRPHLFGQYIVGHDRRS